MKKEWLLSLALGLPLTGCGGGPEAHHEAVVLVHGLGRSPSSMLILSQRLKWAGYQVTIAEYPSRTAPFAEQMATLGETVRQCCSEASRVHFVGHSLGALVIRGYLAEQRPDSLGRVVLLAPPNQGSLFVDWLNEMQLGSDMLGPVGRALGTDATDLPATLPLPDYEVGIIAGNRSTQPIGPPAIPGPDDGIVSIEQASIGDVPMLVLPRSHAFIANSRHTANAVIRFLRTGGFGEGQG
ncbi:MAG: alpha/beta fold hydrolase [Gemmatimonadota bacterium]|nr:alpha/beta fold hydrolase [Gemmatimonadota bacterium]